ncbi:diguanylate cyclase [Anoxybacillus sp. LAT_33]
MYCLMISSAYYVLINLSIQIGNIDYENFFGYLFSLTVYGLVNIFLMYVFFAFLSKQDLLSALYSMFSEGIFSEALISYSVTLLLSFVLGLMIRDDLFFGLFIFTILVMCLSFVFKKFLYLYQEMANQANKDYLTGLYNHGYFKDYLKELFRETKKTGGQFSIAFLDLDDFKKYNDYHGHVQGDRLLKFVGEFLRNETKDLGYIVARYGGEEFAIALPRITKHEAAAFMDQLRKKLNDTPFDGVDRLPYRCISFSCGVAEYESDMYEESELLHKADQALYYSKAQGKNNVQLYDAKRISRDALKFKEDLDAIEEQLKLLLYKDVYTYRHSKRVFKYAMEFSDRLTLTEEEKRTLVLGALVHDIGKIEVSRDIINKTSKLDPDEWEIMKKHVIWGKEIVLSDGRFEEVIPLVELHHERYDGRGYPYGLKGEEIPKLARILCIIDSFDAMTTDRPYQRTKTFSEAIVELRRCSGTQFDPQYVEPFIQMIEEYYPEKVGNENETVSP